MQLRYYKNMILPPPDWLEDGQRFEVDGKRFYNVKWDYDILEDKYMYIFADENKSYIADYEKIHDKLNNNELKLKLK